MSNISADSYTDNNFVGSRVLISNGKAIDESSITSTNLSFLSGVSSSLSATQFLIASNSANWNSAVTSSHNHPNKSTLDLINQSLNTSATVSFNRIDLTSATIGTFTGATRPTRYIGQTMANTDYWQIYGEGSDNNGSMILETGDDSLEAFIFRQRDIGLSTSIDRLTIGVGGANLTGSLYASENIMTQINGFGHQFQNLNMVNISAANTLQLAGTSNSTRAYLKYGNGTLGCDGDFFTIDKPLIINAGGVITSGDVAATNGTFEDNLYAAELTTLKFIPAIQPITATANWSLDRVNKHITGGTYTITLPSIDNVNDSGIIQYATTGSLGTVTVSRSGDDLIYLNGASGVTSITLAANTLYTVAIRADAWYFKS
jgi:hypothetical protein